MTKEELSKAITNNKKLFSPDTGRELFIDNFPIGMNNNGEQLYELITIDKEKPTEYWIYNGTTHDVYREDRL